jgi:hypothetical protein
MSDGPDPTRDTIVITHAQYKQMQEIQSANGPDNVLQFLEEREEDILAEATRGMNRKQRRTFLSQYRKNKK